MPGYDRMWSRMTWYDEPDDVVLWEAREPLRLCEEDEEEDTDDDMLAWPPMEAWAPGANSC